MKRKNNPNLGFKCPDCDRSFTSARGLKRHSHVHEGIAAERDRLDAMVRRNEQKIARNCAREIERENNEGRPAPMPLNYCPHCGHDIRVFVLASALNA
jgi:hypothetical protein